MISGLSAFAQGIPVVDVFDGAKNELVSKVSKEIKDNMYFANKAIIRTPSIKDIITFKINEESKLVFKNAFTATIEYKLTYTDKNNVSTVATPNQKLTINFDPTKDKTYKAYDDFIFDNAYGVKIEIVSYDYSPKNTGWDPTPALQLSMEIQPNHLYQFDRVNNAVTQFTGTGTLNGAMPVADELMVGWDLVTGATEYDLEWSYVDKYADAAINNLINSTNPTDADLDLFVYRNNASRVTLNNSTKNYSIPLFYDGEGTLVYRIRSAQAQPNGQRLEAVWSKSAIFKYSGHQAKLNWQASTSYAEEGKRKSVLQYFDGSLRNRQTVTKDNSTNTTVVAETIYDYQGRPAIQVLPAPTLSNLITYTPNFNTLNNASYDKDNFDLLSSARNICATPAAPLSNQSGAAQYYSASNPLLGNTDQIKKEPYHKFIPDAAGYPFTETQYLQDGTGRVYKQGGVGAQYQLGSGRETVYYYGNPDQDELDALFGTEAGDASHYFKNMVRDANGQYSISYADMHGRTIATALAGDLPPGSSLSNLPSKNERAAVTKILTDKNNNLVKGWTIESSKGLIVTKKSVNTFTYSFDPSSLALPSCPPNSQNIYYDCLYDLEITITGECNNKFNNGQPYVFKKSNFTLGQIDATDKPAEKFAWNFPIELEEGSYTVTKKLTISTDGLNYYRDQVFLKNNVCKTLDQFIQEQKDIFANLQLTCNPTSETCKTKIGTLAAFRAAYLNSNGITAPTPTDELAITLAYNNALKECDRLATNEKNGQNDFQGIYQSMLADVTPGGQYANLDLIDDYSVFRQINGTNLYKYGNTAFAYKDEFGNTDDVPGKYGVYDLNTSAEGLNAKSFIANFKPSWAETLVQAHPEYCKFMAMRDMVGEASYTWDNDFLNTKTYAEALAKGYLNPTASAAIVAQYPGFTTNAANADPLALINTGYKINIEKFLNIAFTKDAESISLWAAASYTGICKGKNDLNCLATQKSNPFSLSITSATCTADLDNAWVSFRSMYYAKKRELVLAIINSAACSVDYAALTKTMQAGPSNDPINFQHTVYFDDPAKKVNEATGLGGFDGTTVGGLSQNEINKKVEDQKQFLYYNTCLGYAQQWWSQLAPCMTNKLIVKQTAIISDLINVCKLGSDDNHINGSSSINPAKTNTFKSFEDVIKAYVNQYNITAAAADKIDPVTCNGLLITYPLPYEAPVPVNKPIVNKPSDCDCGQIAAVRSKYNSLPASVKDASFSNYLQRTQHITISNADLDLLRDLCTGDYTCNFLAKPVILPPGLQCGAGDVCVSCTRVNEVFTSFKADYPGIVPTSRDVDEPQRTYNQLFAKYMNNRLGFGKQAAEYLTFINSCGIANPDDCNDLQKIVSAFTVPSANYIAHYDAGGCDTTTIKIDLGGLFYNAGVSLGESIHDGILQLPQRKIDSLRAAGITRGIDFDFVKAHLCTDSNFTFETRIKMPEATPSQYSSWSIRLNPDFDPAELNSSGNGVQPTGTVLTSVSNLSTNNIGLCSHASDVLKTCTPYTLPLHPLNDWTIVKLKFVGRQCFYYIDDLLQAQTTVSIPVSKLFYWSFATGSLSGAVDYIRVYNSNGGMLYDEEFNGCAALTRPTALANQCPQDCQSAFVQYYNQQKNTSYSYSQIDSVYMSTCGIHPAVCAPNLATGPLLCGRNESIVKTINNYKETTPCDDQLQFSTNRGMEQYNVYKEKLLGEFTNNYIAECMKAVSNESFTVKQTVSEYHYTLYYYDQAGNLVKTVPPAGVNADYTPDWLDAVKTARAAGAAKPQVHTLVTQYRYNTLNQVIAQNTPDAGLSNFWYDRLGRLAISQNAKQKAEANNYSYTKYDWLGRITEVGQINTATTSMADATSRFPKLLDKWFTDNATQRQQITSTQYDLPGKDLSPFATINARNLRNRVSFTSFTAGGDPANYTTATYYNYDIHGNVSTLLQDYGTGSAMGANGQQFKRMDYQYDLISGKVNEVAYQAGYKDQFFHRYSYDAENRLTTAYTSTDYTRWEQDASYQYYKHGPLAHTELGNQRVQGMDNAYTLQGWLKAVNGTVLGISPGVTDMGADGGVNSATRARDVFGYSLQYNDDDYRAIGNATWLTGVKAKLPANGYKPLFNGNISSMAVNIPVIAGSKGVGPMLYNYGYDQLNRLVSMDAYGGGNGGTQLWANGLVATQEWAESISYDANGNIQHYTRHGDTRSSAPNKGMDDLSYVYKANTNQLLQVKDAITTALPADYNDIKDQAANNYSYDAIGNLTSDISAGIGANGISWSVYGKILQVTQTKNNTLQTITYTYDAAGNRISKKVGNTTTWYVRDASGNTMAVYEVGNSTVNSGKITLDEQHIYGSSRLGIRSTKMDVSSLVIAKTSLGNITSNSFLSNFERGNKFFELSNHLGNVLATISDKKIVIASNGTTIDFYEADVATANDYAPFGMQLVGRTFSSGKYRYGFNGKENDNEVKGDGNQQDYGERIYDPRIGKFLSVDPLARSYPMLTPYQFASNRPVDGIDQDGLEFSPAADPMAGQIQSYYLHKLALEHGENPVEYNRSVVNQTAKGHLVTVVVAIDVLLTKGWLSRLAMGSQLFGAFEHNRAKTPEGRTEQNKRSTEAIVNAVAVYGVGKLIGGFIKTLTSTNEIEYAFRKEDYDALVFDPDKGKITSDAIQELKVALTAESKVGTIVGRAPQGSGADFTTSDGLIDVKNAKKFVDAANGTRKEFVKLLGTIQANKDVKYVIDFKGTNVSGEEFDAALKKFYDAGIKPGQIVTTGTSSVENTKIKTF